MYFKIAKACRNFRFMNPTQKYNNKTLDISSGEYLTLSNRLHEDSSKNEYKRSLSTAYRIVAQQRKTASEDERREFNSVFPELVRALTEPYQYIPKVTKLYEKILEGNAPNHQQAPGISIVTGYKKFESPENLTHDNIRLANILGWCVDIMLCSYQVLDDIMDKSEFRRGLPCWYKNEDVGMRALNDAMLLENSPYILLKKYFSGHHCYLPALELFSQITLFTTIGQSLDAINMSNRTTLEETFVLNSILAVALYKGAWPQILLPLKLAMYLAKRYDTEQHRQVERFSIDLANYFCWQNDILDCYGRTSQTGKVGTDIQGGKCTWLAVTAMQRATPYQKAIFKKHYGKPGIENEMEIRALYEKLNILDAFREYEEESYKSICKQIDQMSKDLPQDYFLDYVNVIYG